MRTITVHDKGHTFLLHMGEVPPVPEHLHGPRQYVAIPVATVFLTWWKAEIATRGLTYYWTPEEKRIIAKLTRDHSLEALQNLARHFFQRHATELFEGTYERPLILFGSKLSTIQKELSELV